MRERIEDLGFIVQLASVALIGSLLAGLFA